MEWWKKQSDGTKAAIMALVSAIFFGAVVVAIYATKQRPTAQHVALQEKEKREQAQQLQKAEEDVTNAAGRSRARAIADAMGYVEKDGVCYSVLVSEGPEVSRSVSHAPVNCGIADLKVGVRKYLYYRSSDGTFEVKEFPH